MKPHRFARFRGCILLPATLVPLITVQAYGQGQYDLNGSSNASIGISLTFDGESIGDTHIPQSPYFENNDQRDAFLVRGNSLLTLSSGANVSVINNAGHTAFARVGYGTAGTLNIESGANFEVGQTSRYANFHVGHDAAGIVNQTGGTASFIGSVNIGANGGNGTYTISGGTFNFDQTSGGGVSLLSLGFNNAASSGTSTGEFNINGGSVNLRSSHGGSTQFILGNRVNTASGNGNLNQTSGIFSVGAGAGLFLSGYGDGVYNLSGGSLEIGGDSLQARYGAGAAGNYAFNFSGGSIVVTGSDLVSDVDINVAAGSQSFIDTNGLNATLSGNLTGNGTLVKSGAGNLNLSGDNNLSNEFYVIGGGVNQTGGDSSVRYMAVASGGGTTGSYTITDGSLNLTTALQVGDFGGTGTFTINGGDVTVSGGSFNVGNQGGTGTVNVQSGSLTLGQGLHSLGRMDNRPTNTPAGSGTISLSGGLLEIVDGGSLILGDRINTNSNSTAKDTFGSGTLDQTGGILRVTDGGLFLAGHGATGTGTYNLKGGALEIGGDDLNARYNNSISTYNFNLGGGTLKVIGSDLTSSVDINVVDNDPSAAVSTSIIDTNGFNATLSGNLAGAGTLAKIGNGNLVLSGDNNLTGAFYVAGGAVNQTGGDSTINYFAVGSGAGFSGDFNITGGSLAVTNALQIGDFGGTATFTIDGGDVFVGHTSGAALNIGNQGGNGVLNLESGSLTLGYGQHSFGRMDNRPSGTAAGSGTINVNGGLLEIVDGGSLILGDRIAVNGNATPKDAFGSGTLHQTGGIVRVTDGTLFLAGHGATGTGTYNLDGGALEIGGNDLIARYNNSISTYNFNLGGGTLRVIGSDLTSNVDIHVVDKDPSAAVTASTIDTNGFNATLSGAITGNGAIIKTGGGQLNLTGSVTRSLAYLSASAGTVSHQTGTTNLGSLLVGAYSTSPAGALSLSGGILNVNGANGSVYVGAGAGSNTGTLSITGGTLNLGDSGNPATRVDFYVGAFGTTGTGTVDHSGGVVNKLSDEGTFQIGNQATGIYNLSGTGELNIHGPNGMVLGRSSAGNAGNGTLNISGGTLNFLEGADLSLGGTLATEPAGIGSGTVEQTGGTVSMGNGSLVIGQRGNGTYNLKGGVLEIGGTNRLRQGDGGTASFNMGGGTLRVAGSNLTSSLAINVTTGTSIIDTNGLNASLSGSLTGTGILAKTGLGNLNLSGDNNLTGSFYVAGGAVNQTAGNSTVRYFAVGSGSGASGDFNITGGSLEVTNALQIGDFGGTSAFTIDGGDVFVGETTNGATLNIGNQGGNGVLNLESGSLTLGFGLHSLGRMDNRPAGTAAGSGTINVNGGLLEIMDGGSLILGDRLGENSNSTAKDAFGSGELNQTDGIVRVTNGSLFVAGHGGTGSGTYNLDGGALEIGGGSLRARYNNSISQSNFNLGGGKIRVIGSRLETDVHFNLRTGTTSTIDTVTYGAEVSGFTGDGNLIKRGQSELAITSDSTLGKLTVEEGTVSTTANVTLEDLHLDTNTTFTGSGFVQVNGTITGSGILAVDTRITGTLAVGNSPGVMAVSNHMTVGGTGTLEFDLSGNAAGIAGVTFDQITLSLGTFEMEDGATFSIIFDGTDFATAFWGEDQSWLVVDGDGTGEVILGNVTLTGSQDYSPYGSFSLVGSGDDLMLSWMAIPEPSTALLLVALAPFACYRRRNG